MTQKREFHPPHFYEPGACYFITARTTGRQPVLQKEASRALLRNALRDTVTRVGLPLYAWVILADHYHLLLRLGESTTIGRFIRRLHSAGATCLNQADGTPGRQVWYQYWDRTPRSEDEFWAYFNYIHINPIKHGCVQSHTEGVDFSGAQSQITAAQIMSMHESLAQYPYCSYQYYTRRYGEEFLADIWLRYGFPQYVESLLEQGAFGAGKPEWD